MSKEKGDMADHPVVEDHPFIPVRGRFEDDPTWDEYMENVEEGRGDSDDSPARSATEGRTK